MQSTIWFCNVFFFFVTLFATLNKKPGLLYFWIKLADPDKANCACTTPKMLFRATALKNTFQGAVNVIGLDFGEEFLCQA